MKKIIFSATINIFTLIAFAQNNIGIGTTTPAASAALDITSTSKGLLIPRMTSAQRTAVSSPASGLLVFDTNTKSIWAWDGTAWKNLTSSGGGGSLSLPFEETTNTSTAAFKITNQGTGAALEGLSSNQFGIGTASKSTGEYGWGLYAFSGRQGSKAINAFSDSGIVFNGENQFTGNTNILMNLVNRGLGKTISSQLTNNSSTAANMQIAGNHLAEQLLILQTNVSNTSPAVSISNSGTGAGVSSLANNGTGIIGSSTNGIGISGISNSNYAVKGVTNSTTGFAGVYGQNTGTAGSGVVGVSNTVNTQGIYGTSTNGIGVRANSSNYRAVDAASTSGTALYGSSTNGLALETNGNIKIAGGNTNPTNGAVLTSDAQGNAVWKQRKVAFKAQNIHSSFESIPEESVGNIPYFTNEVYDYDNNFTPLTGNTPDLQSSTFRAPVAGLYHFDAKVTLRSEALNSFFLASIELNLKRGITVIPITENLGDLAIADFELKVYDVANLTISTDVQLQANDLIYLIIYQTGGGPAELVQGSIYGTSQFSGHLIFEN